MNSLEDGAFNTVEVSQEDAFAIDDQGIAGDETSDVHVEQAKSIPKKSIFDRWAEKFKDFLDNAE